MKASSVRGSTNSRLVPTHQAETGWNQADRPEGKKDTVGQCLDSEGLPWPSHHTTPSSSAGAKVPVQMVIDG